MPTGNGHPAREEWLRAIARVVGSDDAEAALTRRTADGVPIPPLCSPAEPRGGTDHPGASPWRRGRRPSQGVGGWDIRPQEARPAPAEANAEILEDLEQGATSVSLCLDRALAAGCAQPDGIVAYDLAALDRALRDVPIERVALALDCGERFAEGAALLFALAGQRGTAAADLRAWLGADPIGCLAAGAALEPKAALARAADMAVYAREHWPFVVPLVADGRPYHAGGATDAQELACVMAAALCYLRRLEVAGLPVDDAFASIACILSLDADLFAGIAKLRAARELFARIAEACGAAAASGPSLGAVTSRRALARTEPWTNLLRSTVAASAAAFGGADSLTILPIDPGGRLRGGIVRRLSRTTQLVLQEESRLHAVIDPGGGSGYIETLTDGLCAAAWGVLQEIEGAGGMLEALRRGAVQAMIGGAWEERRRAAAVRDQVLVGSNRFVAFAEAAAGGTDGLVGALAESVRPTLTGAERTWKPFADLVATAARGAVLVGPPAHMSAIRPIRPHTLDEDWERLRRRGDAALTRNGARPSVFLANLGPPARHAERAAWTRDVLAAGGIEAVTSLPILGSDSASAALSACASAVCVIVAGNALDHELAAAVAEAARETGATRIDLSTGNAIDAAQEAKIGAMAVVRDGTDLAAWLEAVHDALGSPRAAEEDEL